MSTQGMTPEEKAVVMQFMGQTYGQLHQQDQNIVGSATNLKPKSQEMKAVFEQTAHMPTVQQHPQQHPQYQQQPQAAPQPDQPVQPAPQVQQVTPEQAAAELQQAPVPVQIPNTIPVENPDQMEFNLSEPSTTDKLLDLLKEQNLLLKEISLKLDNGKKTTKGRKQS